MDLEMQAKRRRDAALLNYPHSRTDRSLRPRFCLYRSNGELFFVNHTDETLDWVANGSVGGFIDAGGDPVATTDAQTHYEQVLPGEGVLIDAFDAQFDCDLYIASTITVASAASGVLQFQCADKGGARGRVLLWHDGFVSPQVRMEVLTEDRNSK
ncbi:hypothetical protein CEW87_21915 [Parazoarcus communis]|uniref:Uncharacterized protein n=1 Tax=Parazoarcus communis TaxID=41977 RepID=A0A2U8H7V1_9RHOO|nr:hypothetical protein [Parazoarcus communis]AWI81773.1 hypothetical protein CEW87_21915 [Parazoarcus communis]